MSATLPADGPTLAGLHPSAPLQVAIVGTGMIAQLHRRGALLAGARVAAVIGSDRARSRAVAAEWGVIGGPEQFAEMLASPVDVVHICSPNATHLEYAAAALEAGLHVVCEKPLGISLTEARALNKMASRARRIATIPLVYRYHPVVRELRARRIDGDFGRWNLLHGSYLQDWMLSPNAANWRVDPRLGGPSRAFADIGSHWCDLVEFVSGERFGAVSTARSIAYPERPTSGTQSFTTAAPGGPAATVQTEDSAVLLLRTLSGVLATATISQVAAGRKNRLWFELDGADASAVFDQEHAEAAWIGRPNGAEMIARDPAHAHPDAARISTLPAGHAQGYADCFEHFIADTYAAIGGAHPEGLPTFDDGLRSAQIVDAMLRSDTSRTWENIA